MEMKIPAIAITALVVIVVLAGVLMPVLDDATATTDKFTNDGYYDMRYLESDESVTIVWDSSDPTKITVGDEVVTLPATSSSERKTIILGGDDIFFRYYQDIIQITTPNGSAFAADTILTVVCDSGSITATWDTYSRTGSYTTLYVPANDGTFVMKYSDQSAYVKGDSEFIAMGTTYIGESNEILNINGTVDDGATITSWNDELTFSDVVVHSEKVDGYKDLYKLSKITAKSGTTDITYSYFLVPVEVTAEKSVHFTDNENAIFAAIPIMVIVALLIAVVALVFRGRNF